MLRPAWLSRRRLWVTGSGGRLSKASHPKRVARSAPLHLYQGQARKTEGWSGRPLKVGWAWRRPCFSLPEDSEALQRRQSQVPGPTGMAGLPLPQRPTGLWLGGEAVGCRRGPGLGARSQEGRFPTPRELELPLPWLRLLPV